MNVVLVHGFLNRGGIMRGLAAHLEACGHACFVPSMKPNDAREGIGPLADGLRRYIEDSLPADSRFAIIGFSMGALVSRYYLQELGGIKRAEALLSIAGPHSGTLTANLFPGIGTKQMRPGSGFLAHLDQTAANLGNLPVTCYWSPMDLMIIPQSSARWPRGERVKVWAPVHSLLLFDRSLYRDVESRLSAFATKGRKEPAPVL